MLKGLGRWAPLTGVVFAVSVLRRRDGRSGSTPDSDALAQKCRHVLHVASRPDRRSVFLIVYAVVFGLFFAAALRSYLRARSAATV